MEKPHKDLRAWELAMELVDTIYEITAAFPSRERSQLRRSAISIPSNIAEGAARGSRADVLRFLRMALGSLSEVDTQIEISKRQRFIDDQSFRAVDTHLTKTDKVLAGLIRHIEKKFDAD